MNQLTMKKLSKAESSDLESRIIRACRVSARSASQLAVDLNRNPRYMGYVCKSLFERGLLDRMINPAQPQAFIYYAKGDHRSKLTALKIPLRDPESGVVFQVTIDWITTHLCNYHLEQDAAQILAKLYLISYAQELDPEDEKELLEAVEAGTTPKKLLEKLLYTRMRLLNIVATLDRIIAIQQLWEGRNLSGIKDIFGLSEDIDLQKYIELARASLKENSESA